MGVNQGFEGLHLPGHVDQVAEEAGGQQGQGDQRSYWGLGVQIQAKTKNL